jgi:hypothetical protein
MAAPKKQPSKPKAPRMDPEKAMGAAGWFLKSIYRELSTRMDRLEAAVCEGRRPKR